MGIDQRMIERSDQGRVSPLIMREAIILKEIENSAAAFP
jgi:hypothetical protein